MVVRNAAGRPPRTLRSIAIAGEPQPGASSRRGSARSRRARPSWPPVQTLAGQRGQPFHQGRSKRSKAGASETQLRPYLQRVIAAAFLPGLLAVARSDIAQHRRSRRACFDLGQRVGETHYKKQADSGLRLSLQGHSIKAITRHQAMAMRVVTGRCRGPRCNRSAINPFTSLSTRAPAATPGRSEWMSFWRPTSQQPRGLTKPSSSLRPLSAQLPSTNYFCERNEGIEHA